MFDRILNTLLWYPVQNSVYEGASSKKTSGGEYGLIIKVLEIHIKITRKFFWAARVLFFFFICQREKQKHYFLTVDKISKLCSTSESSKRSPTFSLEHHRINGRFWKVFHQRSSKLQSFFQNAIPEATELDLNVSFCWRRGCRSNIISVAKVIPLKQFL